MVTLGQRDQEWVDKPDRQYFYVALAFISVTDSLMLLFQEDLSWRT